MHSLLILLVWVGVGIFTVYTELQWDKYICDFFTRQTNVVIACFWRDMGFVASTRFCRESGFVANTRFFGLVLSRLLLRHKGFYSDFVQISVQNIGGWDLCSQYCLLRKPSQTLTTRLVAPKPTLQSQRGWARR